MYRTTLEPGGVVVIDVAGQVDAVEMQVELDELSKLTHALDTATILMRLHDVHMPTLGAIAVELRHIPQFFALLRQVHRVAVLTDQDWIRRWVSIESAVIPMLEMRSFGMEDEDAARAWLTGAEPAPAH